MIGAPNSLNLNSKTCVMKEAPGPSVSEEIADIFRDFDINSFDKLDKSFHLFKYENRFSSVYW